VQFDGKRDGILFARVKVPQRSIPVGICASAHFHPRWGMHNPVPDQRRRIVPLVANDRRQDRLFKQSWKNVDMPDQNEIVNRAGIGNDDPHPSEP